MTKLAVIDLDGVVANNEARFAKAEEAKAAYLDRLSFPDAQHSKNHAEQVFWQEAFNPELVSLDTLIEGVPEAMRTLNAKGQGYKIALLTSRPELMREATEDWLLQYDLYTPFYPLIMKPSAFQYTKTTVWKAGTIQMLHCLYNVDDLIVVDDEPANQKAVLDAYPDGGGFGIVRVYGSLAEAVAAL